MVLVQYTTEPTPLPLWVRAVVIVIAPELPYMGWLDIKGGKFVQQSAREQAEKLLRPYMGQLMRDPRNELPKSGESLIQAANGCGQS